MALERRKHPRHRPLVEIVARLGDQGGGYESPAQLFDLSEGGCSLLLKAPPRGATVLSLQLPLQAGQPPLELSAQMTARCALGDAWQVSLSFAELPAGVLAALRAALASDRFSQAAAETATPQRKHWRVDQWAAYLTAQDLPVMTRSKEALAALEADPELTVSARDLADLANRDPFLCLCLLREAENRRTSRLGHETTTPLAAAMQIGVKGFRELLLSSPETDEGVAGLGACEARAAIAGRLAAGWSTARSDISPDELVMAALLCEMGELLLWHFAPELPEAAQEALARGEAHRSVEAQELRCGFKFKDLTVKCAEIWRLPAIIVQLIRGHDNARANIARICVDTARHLAAGGDNPALPDDLADAKTLIPGGNMAWLASWMTEVPEELRPALVERAEAALEKRRQEAEAQLGKAREKSR